MHVKKIKKITKKGEYVMTSESTFVEMNQEEYIDCYRNYRFDKKEWKSWQKNLFRCWKTIQCERN